MYCSISRYRRYDVFNFAYHDGMGIWGWRFQMGFYDYDCRLRDCRILISQFFGIWIRIPSSRTQRTKAMGPNCCRVRTRGKLFASQSKHSLTAGKRLVEFRQYMMMMSYTVSVIGRRCSTRGSLHRRPIFHRGVGHTWRVKSSS